MKNAFLLVPLLMGVNDAYKTAATPAENSSGPVANKDGILSIYKTPAFLEIEFATAQPFSTEEIYQIEEVTTKYLEELLTNDDSLKMLEEKDSVIDLSVNVQTQQTSGNDIYLGSKVDVVHYGDVEIPDVAALLTYLVNKNNTDSSFIYLDHILPVDAAIELISFDFISQSIPAATNLTTIEKLNEVRDAKKYGSEKTLIVVTTLLSLTLFGMSAILIWVGGGWLSLRARVRELLLREEELTRMTMNKNIVSKPTMETDEDEESPVRRNQSMHSSGMYTRGSQPNNSMYGLGVKTPSRMGSVMSEDDLGTPMSVMSDYSDTNRAPLGIMSMRKLVPPRDNNDDEHSRNTSSLTAATAQGSHASNSRKLEY